MSLYRRCFSVVRRCRVCLFGLLFRCLVTVLILGGTCFAATTGGGGWSQQPSWSSSGSSSGGGDSYSQRRSQYAHESGGSVSPFSPTSNNFALDVGQVFLMGDISDTFADSIGAQIHYTYGVSDMFGFDASFGYSDHSDGKYSLTTLLTGLRTNLSWYDKVVPYLVLGLGFYKPSRQLAPGTSISPVVFGIHVGPGVDLELTKQFFFGAAVTFHDMFGTTKNSVQGPIEFDGTFTSFLLHVGMTF